MLNPRPEAELIVEALFQDYGTGGCTEGPCPFVDGREAILEMKEDHFPGWQEVEWAGYHIKYMVQKICEEKLTGEIGPYDSKKRHLVKGKFLWDARLKASENKDVPLGDLDEYKRIVEQNGGIGILVVDVVASYDLNEDFRRWHEEQKGGLSNYSIERELEGRPARKRKTAYMISKVLAYFFSFEGFERGIAEGWINDTFQFNMRNADGSTRNPKYRLRINDIPKEDLLFAKNFNEEPEEFKEDYPDFS